MTRSSTNYRTAMVALTAGDSIREAHSYEYDNNGNILYVNTLRLKPDMTAQPDTVQRSREERFRWDEENRLTALSQNGYVSNYWYDANGDRVIKEHGENMAVFVNSRQDGCVTQTGRYSVYPNPYYSYGDDGSYTKHIYIGGERVLSQVGGVYGEPRLLDVAGHDVRIKVDYPQIRASQDSVMEAAYSHFDLPYALEGQPRQLREFVLPAGGDNEAEAPALRSGDKDNYNGNISAMEWQARDAMMAAAPTRHHYSYSYDGLNRLTAASHGTTGAATWSGHLAVPTHCPRDYSCSYQYDSNGNLTALTRKGVSQVTTAGTTTVWQYGTIDDLSLTYDGNRLKKVADQCADLTYEGAMDFSDGANRATEYTYDANGNMTADANKGIRRITYNVLNLPQEVTFTDGHIIRYRYAADGRKLRTEYVLSNYTVIDNPGGPSILHSGGAQPMGGGTFTPGDGLPDPENQLETTLMVRNYCGNHIYRDGALERITGDYGYMDGEGGLHYYIKDYQGNVRAVIDGQGALEEVNNYYPYGALMGGGTVGNNASMQPYKYGTKELDRQNGLDWYDSQARHYDPLLGRTPTIDPKAEDYAPISPYAWCAGNPVRFVDPTGEFYTDNINDDTIYPLVAFFPSERDEALEIDYQVAREQNVPMFVVDNLGDFVDAMNCLNDMLGSSAMAIAINSHGSPGSFYVGETRIDGLTDLSDLKNILEGMEVFLGSCNTGAGLVGERFTQHFSQETGTVTVSSRHPLCAGYRYNGGSELGGNGHPYINQFLGLDGENTFLVSEMGSKSNEIYNVRIDKNFGISWETGLYYEAVRPYTIINNLFKKGL